MNGTQDSQHLERQYSAEFDCGLWHVPNEKSSIVLSFIHTIRKILINPAHIMVVVAIFNIAHALGHSALQQDR